ncbi:MAG: glycosyltransferase family 4 protein [Candidatus Moranbacteria bacterium]|nr:glycosyltransferase family 4 protein [Candidatus Moranbacteria bacterium]
MQKDVLKLNVALAHDFLIYLGGAERVLQTVARLFPRAPIYTLLKNKKTIRSLKMEERDIIPSFLNRAHSIVPHRWLLPFYPLAAESIDLRNFDLVISSTSSFMKGVIVKPRTFHVCYCHAPTRYLWDLNEKYLDEALSGKLLKTPKGILVKALLNYLRMWDHSAARRVDLFIANSQFTAKRIKKYYQRKSLVVYPPVAVENFSPNIDEGRYFLVVSRLSSYKKIDLVVEAFNRLKWPLIIAGAGSEKNRLRKIAGPNIRFVGFVKEKKLPKLYAGAKAFVFPGEDDFGITMVEAMASGKPVLALRSGGALEIVEEGKTGEFFDAPEVEILADGLRRIAENKKSYSPEYIRLRAERFSAENFSKNFMEVIKKAIGKANPKFNPCKLKISN